MHEVPAELGGGGHILRGRPRLSSSLKDSVQPKHEGRNGCEVGYRHYQIDSFEIHHRFHLYQRMGIRRARCHARASPERW